MITRLEVKNFKNIKNSAWTFLNKDSIFSGKNGLGKSNTLNAIVWALADSILTDNYGVGENDLDQIIPVDFVKGMHTEVSIWVDDVKLTKLYKTRFERGSDTPNGHTTDYKINDAPANRTEYTATLNKLFKYEPFFKELNIKEVNMNIDPLFLEKVDSKSLRKILGALGCNVTNEEIYAKGYEDLRPYEAKYMGKFDKMKQDYTKKRTEANKEVEVAERVAASYADIEGVAATYQERIQYLNGEKEKLLIERQSLASGDASKEISDMQHQIDMLRMKHKNSIQLEIQKLNSDIASLTEQMKRSKEDANHALALKVKPLEDEVNRAYSEISSLRKDVQILENQANAGKDRIKTQIELGKQYQSTINSYSVRVNTLYKQEFTNNVVCPCCGTEFAPNPEEERLFNEHKQNEIDSLNRQIKDLQTKLAAIKPGLVEIDSQIKNAVNEKTRIELDIQVKNQRLMELKAQIATIYQQPVDNTSNDQIIESIANLKAQRTNLEGIQVKDPVEVTELTTKVIELKNNSEEALRTQRMEIDTKVSEIATQIEETYMKLGSIKNRDEANARYEEAVQNQNDVEFIYGRVTDFLHEMVRCVNEKASKLFDGIDFVLLEENLTNAGLTDVCYATVGGIEYKSLNTSQKNKVGIQFIQGVRKYIAAHGGVENELPILCDKLESIDSMERIRSLTEYQLIGTRVSDKEEITLEN